MVKIGAKIDEVRIDGDLSRLRRDLEHFTQIGLDAVELPVHGLDAIINGRLDAAQVAKIKRILRDFDFHYSVHAPNPLNLMNQDFLPMHLAVFRASLQFAREINAPNLVYHPGRYVAEETFFINAPRELSPADQQHLLDLERSILDKLAAEYPTVTICLENARPYIFHSPYCYAEKIDLLKRQVEEVHRENVKITLDLGHLFMAARYYDFDPVAATAAIKDLIAHCHIHDNFGSAVYHHEKQQTHQLPFGRGDSHMPVGWGEIPIPAILAEFMPTYQGTLLMELRSRYFQDTDASQKNLKEILILLKQPNQQTGPDQE